MCSEALSLTYGRFFAEFLGDLSLVRLGLLDLTTCVGLRYGSRSFNSRGFSWKDALPNPPTRKSGFPHCSDVCLPDFPKRRPHRTNANPIMRSEYSPPSPH